MKLTIAVPRRESKHAAVIMGMKVYGIKGLWIPPVNAAREKTAPKSTPIRIVLDMFDLYHPRG